MNSSDGTEKLKLALIECGVTLEKEKIWETLLGDLIKESRGHVKLNDFPPSNRIRFPFLYSNEQSNEDSTLYVASKIQRLYFPTLTNSVLESKKSTKNANLLSKERRLLTYHNWHTQTKTYGALLLKL